MAPARIPSHLLVVLAISVGAAARATSSDAVDARPWGPGAAQFVGRMLVLGEALDDHPRSATPIRSLDAGDGSLSASSFYGSGLSSSLLRASITPRMGPISAQSIDYAARNRDMLDRMRDLGWRNTQMLEHTRNQAWRNSRALDRMREQAWSNSQALGRMREQAWRNSQALDRMRDQSWRNSQALERMRSQAWRNTQALDRMREQSWRSARALERIQQQAWHSRQVFDRMRDQAWRSSNVFDRMRSQVREQSWTSSPLKMPTWNSDHSIAHSARDTYGTLKSLQLEYGLTGMGSAGGNLMRTGGFFALGTMSNGLSALQIADQYKRFVYRTFNYGSTANLQALHNQRFLQAQRTLSQRPISTQY
jgi:hypothetical protein